MDERNARIISSITTLAHNLNMVVIAEGVETQEQIDRLAALGVGYAQGYFIGRPTTAEAAGEMLQGISAQIQPSSLPLFSAPPTPSSLYLPLTGVGSFTAPKSLTEVVGTLEDVGTPVGETESLPSLFALTRPEKVSAPAKAKKKTVARAKQALKRGR